MAKKVPNEYRRCRWLAVSVFALGCQSTSGAQSSSSGPDVGLSDASANASDAAANDATDAAADAGSPLDSGATSTDGGPTDGVDGADLGGTLIGPAGGVFSSGSVTVTIPAGALEGEHSFNVAISNEGVIQIEPSVVLHKPALVSFEVDPTQAATGDDVQWNASPDDWFQIASLTVDANVATFEISHFSVEKVPTSKRLRSAKSDSLCWEDDWQVGDRFPTQSEREALGPVTAGSLEKVRAEAAGFVGPLGPASPPYQGCLVDIRSYDTAHAWHGLTDSTLSDKYVCDTDDDCRDALSPNTVSCKDGKCVTPRNLLGESFLMSFGVAGALASAAERVKKEIPGYAIFLNGALDTSGLFHDQGAVKDDGLLDPTRVDAHYLGSAVDLSLCKGACNAPVSDAELADNFPQLAPVLYAAGFSWVLYETPRHIHASVAYSGCGYANPACIGRTLCSCDKPTTPPGAALGDCEPNTGGGCPACAPQAVQCSTTAPPVAGCIAGLYANNYCCPALSQSFPCYRVAPGVEGYSIDQNGETPECATALLADLKTHAPIAYACATDQDFPQCWRTGGGYGVGCAGSSTMSTYCCSQ
jgi:hypothetical protein